MNRSIWKGPFTRISTIQSRKDATENTSGMVQVWSRAFMITPDDLSRTYYVYSGKRWVKVRVVEEMIGHRLGEFCNTRKETTHKVYKQKQSHRKGSRLTSRPS